MKRAWKRCLAANGVYYRAVWIIPVGREELGQVYKSMEGPEDAAAAYRRFIAAWEQADPELQPRVEKARERLKALGSPAS